MNRVRFYTTEEIKAIEHELINNSNNVFLTEIAEDLGKKFNRPFDGMLSKVHQVKRKLSKNNIIQVDEFQYRKSINPNKKPVDRPVIKKSLHTLIEKPLHTVIEKQPTDIGVDVPHGMTFEGKPKRITLHSDHFRIYF
jgi:hypothetical protein